MANITQLTPNLWTGGDLPYPESAAIVHLGDWDRHGITHVIDNRQEWSDEELVAWVSPQIAYLHNGVDDAGQAMPDDWFDTGVGFALDAWQTNPDSVVLAHCHMGINRGPSMAYAILLSLGWDPIDAVDHIRTQRPIAAVGYVEDALDWHLRRREVTPTLYRKEHERLQRWILEHPHDTVRIIRGIRASEQEAS